MALDKNSYESSCCKKFVFQCLWKTTPKVENGPITSNAWESRYFEVDKRKPCRYAERQTLLTGLTEAGVSSHAPVHLVCIEQELESWSDASPG